ncbi:MAG: RNA-binding domain-containing protein [Promethearchaeota archaeon]
MITVILSAELKATEDEQKVQEALMNICPTAKIEIISNVTGRQILQGKATGPEAIDTLAKKFREQRILEAVRHSLLKRVENNTLVFGIARQAALVNRFHLCELDDISAMGPIRIEIHAKRIYDLIDYICPPTVKGKPQFRRDIRLE